VGFTHVDKPLTIGPVTLKNRVCRSAHVTGLANGRVTPDLVAYHEARARGGVGMSILEVLSVHPSSPSSLNAWLPDIADSYGPLVEACRTHGMELFHQIWHGGSNFVPVDESAPWSASPVPGVSVGQVPVAMTKTMIDDVIEGFARAAAMCESVGLSGAEVHGAHGYLCAQFLSPLTNRREDDYGGSFENRARFTVEVMRAVKGAVSKDFAVGIRLAPDLLVGGIGVADSIRLLKMLEAEALLHFVDCSLGNYQTFDKIFSGMHDPAGYEMETSAQIAHATELPVMVTGRFRTLEEADAVIRAGDAQLVSMTRAHIADPDIVRKTLAGRPEDVRPCIGCNQGCLGGLFGPRRRLGCTVNTAVGRELMFDENSFEPAPTRKKIVVVGGGPAGMEAARVASRRGHEVVLLEAQPALGGQVTLSSKAPTRRGIIDITVWQEEQVYKLGVDVRLSTYAELDDILAECPDEVILATGSFPTLDGVQLSNPGEPIEGIGNRGVMSSHDLFYGANPPLGERAVVIDDVGHYEAIAAAEYLQSLGLAVTFVTRHISFAPMVETAMMTTPALRRMGPKGLQVRLRSRAIRIGDGGVEIGPTYLPTQSQQTELIPADTVVIVSANTPNNGLLEELRGAGIKVTAVGDANAPRFLQAAIRDGYLAGAAV
jgi:2,4-dienoyl-CoA reductase-like NADH-dependent reductase (Old Yellow Enzyme family)